jgi:hypothetical protein
MIFQRIKRLDIFRPLSLPVDFCQYLCRKRELRHRELAAD